MINKWNFQTPSEEELHKRDQLVAELGFSPVICLLLVQRGITSIEEAKKFFKPSLNDLHDPFLMPDMDKAVRRLNKALGNKEKILIYGDYDVDGTTAVSLVFKYLRPYSSTLDFYIPDRYDVSKRSRRSSTPRRKVSTLLFATTICQTPLCRTLSPYWMPSARILSIRMSIYRVAEWDSSSCRRSPRVIISRSRIWRSCWN